MAHIRSLGLENFRVFSEKTDFEFSPITILTGTNSSGKSTVINALHILKRYLGDKQLRQLDEIGELSLSDIGERLGDFTKLVNRYSDHPTIAIYLPTHLEGVVDEIKLKLEIGLGSGKLRTGKLVGFEFFSKNKNKIICSVRQNEDDCSVLIDYNYFFQEYKRESDQVQRFYEVDNALKEVEDVLWQIQDIEGLASDKIELEKKQKALQKQLKKIHGHFLLAQIRERNMMNAPNIDFEDNLYAPYFPLYKNLHGNPFYTPGMTLFRYGLGSVKNSENQVIEEKRKNIIKGEELFLTDLRFTLSNENETDAVRRSRQDNRDEYFIFTENKRDHIFSVFETLADPCSEIVRLIRGMDKKISLTSDQKESYLYFYVNEMKYSLDLWEYPDGDISSGYLTDSFFFFRDFVSYNLLSSIRTAIACLQNCNFLSSIRSTVKRAYSSHHEESELNSIILDTMKKGIATTDNSVTEFVNKYLQAFELGEKLVIERDEEGISTKIYLQQSTHKTLLADLGYGISQMLPILLKIANLAHNSFEINGYSMMRQTLCIEEPETNLHPALQSKLADMLVEAYKKFKIQFIIETHSEYLIRKFQYLTAKGDIDPSFTSLFYFYNPDKIPPFEKQVKKISMAEDGSLSDDFGTGFFDEADKIAISIWNMNKSQKN